MQMEFEETTLGWLMDNKRYENIAVSRTVDAAIHPDHTQPFFIEGIDPKTDGTGAYVWFLDGSDKEISVNDTTWCFWVPA